ncbi:MAG: holo-ACP synthase [Thermotogaceae bacterium]|nr:holo-ACP synthase [Thermotogaceae bacterium]
MIVGNGIDVVRIDRVSLNLSKKILTEREKKIFDSLKLEEKKREFLAGRFAAKEAFFKALGSGVGKNSFLDVSILNAEKGRPFILIEKDFEILFNYAYVSVSHDFVAVASVILERRKGAIIANFKPDFCELLEIIDNDLYELDCDIPPFELKRVLEEEGFRLIKYGNIWEASYFEN